MPSLSTLTPSHTAASRWLLAVAILAPVLLLGGIHTPILIGVAVLVTVAMFIAWFPAAPMRARLPATILVMTALALTGFTALQACALPAGLVHALSPMTADVWAGALSPLHEPGPAWTALSLDPIATRVEVLRGVVYLSVFLVALRVVEHRGGTRFLSMVIILAAIALAASALLHPLLGLTKVFGIYKPQQDIAERHIAPLLNPNHLGAYLNIGYCLALGMALDRRADRFRPIAIAFALLLIATQVWVASRGAMLAMATGTACIILTSRVARRFSIKRATTLLLPGIILVAGIAMIVLGSTPEASNELNSLDVSKVRIALSGLALVTRYPFFGAGRGAFDVAYPAVRTEGGYQDVEYPENIVVQWVTEWGLPVALAGAIAIGIALRPRVLLVSSSPAIGAWGALLTTLVHNLVDFNSEVPAVGIAAAACAAMVVGGRGNERRGKIHEWGSRPRRVAVFMAGAATVAIALALVGMPHEIGDDRRELFKVATTKPRPEDGSQTVRAALLRHPSEAYMPFIGSVDAARLGTSVMPWVERTLELAPIYGPAHYVLAQQLASQNASQARLEYRLAITQDMLLSTAAIDHAEPLVQTFDDAIDLVPVTAPGQTSLARMPVLERLASILQRRLPATSARIDETIRKLDENERDPVARAVHDDILDLDMGPAAPWCTERRLCVKQGLVTVKRLIALEPGRCEPFILRARLEIAGDEPNGLKNLAAATQTVSDPDVCWRWLGELAVATQSEAYVTMAEEALGRAGCVNDNECADNFLFVASLEERRGNSRRAMNYYEKAHERAPDREDIVYATAKLASDLGLHAQALEAFRNLERMSSDASKWRASAEKEKMQLFHEGSPQAATREDLPPETSE
jgi:hypothetical protein